MTKLPWLPLWHVFIQLCCNSPYQNVPKSFRLKIKKYWPGQSEQICFYFEFWDIFVTFCHRLLLTEGSAFSFFCKEFTNSTVFWLVTDKHQIISSNKKQTIAIEARIIRDAFCTDQKSGFGLISWLVQLSNENSKLVALYCKIPKVSKTSKISGHQVSAFADAVPQF